MIYVKIPRTASTFFESNFYNRFINYKGEHQRIISVGHSWVYPTQIKGWRDWDYPNQPQGIFRDVLTYSIPRNETIITIVRNPFDLLISYFNYNWAWCRKFHNLSLDKNYPVSEFRKFVDIYLDDTIEFHAPALRKSLFSQLKDIDGNWLIDDTSIILRFENLDEDIKNFSNQYGIGISDTSKQAINSSGIKPIRLESAYSNEQIEKLSKLWETDLKYFSYEPPITN